MMPAAEVSNIVTCWLPLGDATIETGCMQALPGVFNLGYLSHFKEEAATVTIRPEVLPSVEPMDLVCCKGDVVLLIDILPALKDGDSFVLQARELCYQQG